MYEDIIRLLDGKRLKEALDSLEVLSRKNENWKVESEVGNLKTTYGYMLQYAAQGVQDPGRDDMYCLLRRRAYELASQAEFSRKCSSKRGHFADKYQAFRRVPPHTYGEIGLILESITEDMEVLTLTVSDEEKRKEAMIDFARRRVKAVDELFDRTWVSDGWSEEDFNEAKELLHSALISENDIAVLVSAVTLNLLQVFDVRKVQFLLEAYGKRKEPVVSQRALIGIVLVFSHYGSWIKMYPELANVLTALEESHEALERLHGIQILFLLSRETEKIDKKMREEIIPEMMKNPKFSKADFKISDIEDLEDLNPEWKADMEKINERMRELGELQMEGADTYMGTFSQLKHFSFFTQAAHWFYPFDKWVPEVSSVFLNEKIGDKTFLGMLLKSPVFCNSDKYSFCLTLSSIPADQRQMLNMQIEGQDGMLQENMNNLAAGTADRNIGHAVARQYIHDLYRYFKLWMFKREQVDIFLDKQDFWTCDLLRPLLLKGKYQKKLADYLFSKGYYEESARLYDGMIDEGVKDVEVWQKLGFSLQKEKQYEKAIQAYKRADVLKPNHSWTLKHLAQCYKRMADYETAATYFCMVEQMQPENLNLLMQIGQCLAKTCRYQEALSYFFKVEYLNNAPIGAWRAIAWCYFMTGKQEEALRFYDKLQKSEEVQVTDWLNAGHVYLVQGKITDALACYRKARELSHSADRFYDIFRADKDILMQQGVPESDIDLMPDLL